MPELINVRFQDVKHKIASVVTLLEEEDYMARLIQGRFTIGKLKEEIIDKIKIIAENKNISESDKSKKYSNTHILIQF